MPTIIERPTAIPPLALTSLLAFALASALVSACSARNHIGFQASGAAGAGGSSFAGAGGSSDSAAGGGGGGASGGSDAEVDGAAPGGMTGSGGTTGAAGAVGTGGATGTGPQPRVLIVDPATGRFVSYDRTGQQVRDYGPHLEFGPGFAARSISLEGSVTVTWDVPSLPTGVASPRRPQGIEEPLRASVIVIGAVPTAGGGVKIKLVGAGGAPIASHTLPSTWDAFKVSPQRGYLYTHKSDPAEGTQSNAVFRASDGQMVWLGWAASAGFARDDSHFVFLPGNSLGLPHVIDLATGADTAPTSTQIPAPSSHPGVTYGLDAVLDELAVFRASWDSYGVLFWAVDWRGQVTRFGLDMPMHVTEYLQGFDPTGTKAVLSRQSNGSGGQPPGPLGAFELDLVNKAATSWSGPDFSCFGRPDQVAFKIEANMVHACSCSDGTCRAIAAVPSGIEAGWVPELVVGPDRRTVILTHGWSFSRLPTSFPETIWMRADGEVVARLPWSLVQIDDTGQLLLLRGWVVGPTTAQLGIADLVTGRVTWIDRPEQAAILYE